MAVMIDSERHWLMRRPGSELVDRNVVSWRTSGAFRRRFFTSPRAVREPSQVDQWRPLRLGYPALQRPRLGRHSRDLKLPQLRYLAFSVGVPLNLGLSPAD